VLSRRAVVEASQGEERAKMMSNLKEGSVVQGIVKNITDYGAFVDLGGIDGLLHITDLAWRRVRHPSEMLTVGQEVTAKILKFDQEKNRVSLGVKQLSADPSGASSATEDKSEAKPKAKSAKTKEVASKVPDDGAVAGTTNLGALLKAKLDSKK
jgi:ribosomal protein S1